MALVIPPVGSDLGFFIQSPGALPNPSPLLADNIDPETNDFASLFTGMNVIDAQVIVAVTFIRGTGAAITEDGIKFTSRKMTTSINKEIEADVRIALGRLIKNGDIRLESVSYGDNDEGIDHGNQTANVLISYVNLRALDNKVRIVEVPFTPSEG
jgi:hypothetical protein